MRRRGRHDGGTSGADRKVEHEQGIVHLGADRKVEHRGTTESSSAPTSPPLPLHTEFTVHHPMLASIREEIDKMDGNLEETRLTQQLHHLAAIAQAQVEELEQRTGATRKLLQRPHLQRVAPKGHHSVDFL